MSRAGPKSGNYLNLVVLAMLQQQVVGVRVASTAAVEAGPDLRSGKLCSGALSMPLDPPAPRHSEKRAYRHARLRAARAGGTMYRGRWHSAATLQALPYAPKTSTLRSATRAVRQRAGRTFTLQCLSWNAGGLSSDVFQEFVAWVEAQGRFHALIVQETHWKDSSEFLSGNWMCVHSAAASSDQSQDRFAGVLVMLSRAHFKDPAVHEVVNGRLLHVRAQLVQTGVSVDFLAVYQHVWRSHLSHQANKELRGLIWDALDLTVQRLPVRNILVACGDYNTNLRTCHPHVGAAVGPITSASSLDDNLSKLLAKHDLCALNSWHARPAHTFTSHTGVSQIDYIITRRHTATGASRQARPVYHFPVAGWRQAGHLPLQAQIPALPIHWRPGMQAQLPPKVDKARLVQAAAAGNGDAIALQELVANRLREVPTADLHALHARINAVLLQCVQEVFPYGRAPDNRVSAQVPFQLSARHTWRLYAMIRRPRVATVAAVLHKWKLHMAFARASKALRQQSRDLKRASFADKLAQAEAAAQRGDQRTLYQVVRSLAPTSSRLFSRLRDAEGHFLSKPAEALALVAQGKTTYALYPDKPIEGSMRNSLAFTDAEITEQLQATKAAKAIPGHMAPAAAWKVCAKCLGPLFGAAFRKHFAAGQDGIIRGDFTDAHMVMLPKAGKSPHVLENLRPIGLMGPPSKALAGALRDRLLTQLSPLTRYRPQFAYTAGRGTFNALLRIHQHVADALSLVRANRISRFGRYAGRRPLALAGALSISLDLSRAFDLADRCAIYRTLERYQVPGAVIDAVQRLHTGSKFVYKAGSHQEEFVPTNGLKQGCKIAPCLWVWYTMALFDTLAQRLTENWVRDTPTLFADDCWASWLIKSTGDLQRALRELQILLCTLEDYKMRINFTKTAILVKLVGKQAAQALHEHTCFRRGTRHLIVVVNGTVQHVPIKLEHEYLGSKVSYHNPKDGNLDHRLQVGQLRYQAIRRVLTGKHVVAPLHRVRLWSACVLTSMSYSLAAVGFTSKGLQKWETRATKHVRAILRKPAHLTRTTNDEVWSQAHHPRPGDLLLAQLTQARQRLENRAGVAPDITTAAGILEHVRGLESQLRQLLVRRPKESVSRSAAHSHVCTHCDAAFLTEHALRIHLGVKHPTEASRLPRRTASQKLDPAIHSVGGMPHCRACGRKFAKWQFFKYHVESGACEAMGGDSFTRKPPAEVDLREEIAPPEQPPVATAACEIQNLPLVRRPYFLQTWHRWETLLSNAAIRQELKSHCVLCHFWVADYQHIKQHQRRTHLADIQPLLANVVRLCKPFKSQLRSGSNCPWCSCRVWAPARHAETCPVLYQLILAAQYCQAHSDHHDGRQRHGGEHERRGGPQPGGGHLQVRVLCERSDDPAPGPSGSEHSAAKATPSGAAVPTQREPKPTARGRAPTTGSRPKAAQPRHSPHHDKNHHPAGGSAGGAPARQGLLHFPPRGPGDERDPRPGPNLQRLAQSSGGGRPGVAVAVADSVAGLSHQASEGAHGADDLHFGGNRQATGGGMVGSGRGVDLLSLEPSGEKAEEARGKRDDLSTGSTREGGLSLGQPARGHRPEVQLQAETLRDGGGKPDYGNILHVDLSARGPLASSPRLFRTADRGRSSPADRGLSEAGNTEAVATRAAVGRDCFPLRAPTSEAVDTPEAATAHPSSRDCHERPPAQPLPRFTLVNDGNACYINATVYALWHVANCTNTLQHLPKALASLTGRGVHAKRAIQFQLLGWRAAHLQHDIAEFIDFFLPRTTAARGHAWCGRTRRREGVFDQLTGPLNKCLSLPAPPLHRPELQALINRWHLQESLHALCGCPPWVFVQLPRFAVDEQGHITKTAAPYLLTGTLRLPVFREPGSLHVEWRTYRITCYIRHHGRTPALGHYTVLTNSDPPYLLDDAAQPKKATEADLEDTSTSMYVLVLGLTSQLVLAAAPSPSPDLSAGPGSLRTDAGDGLLSAGYAPYEGDMAEQPSGLSRGLATQGDSGCASTAAATRPIGGALATAHNSSAGGCTGPGTQQSLE